MKLLLDQNLSWRLVKPLQGSFPESAHVRDLGLDRASDVDVWEYARREGFVIISKDSDVEQRSIL
jgi:predicted nuclease of predicted toxin-antitoxin system